MRHELQYSHRRRPAPFSLRLTPDERADLAADMGAALKLEGRKAAYRERMRREQEQERKRGHGPGFER